MFSNAFSTLFFPSLKPNNGTKIRTKRQRKKLVFANPFSDLVLPKEWFWIYSLYGKYGLTALRRSNCASLMLYIM